MKLLMIFLPELDTIEDVPIHNINVNLILQSL